MCAIFTKSKQQCSSMSSKITGPIPNEKHVGRTEIKGQSKDPPSTESSTIRTQLVRIQGWRRIPLACKLLNSIYKLDAKCTLEKEEATLGINF